LKACGLFTAAVEKRNPFYRPDRVSATAFASIFSLVAQVILSVPFAQFVHEMLQVRGQTRRHGTQILLQPFAYGVADRSGGLAIDPFAVVGDSAIHREFRFLIISRGNAEPSHRDGNCFLVTDGACAISGGTAGGLGRFHAVRIKQKPRP
jgi:hypothetical protein